MTDIVADQVDVVGRAFLGLTLACARCHDHKFDPISTADYYAANRDVAHSGMNALYHYIKFGRREGRLGALHQRHLSSLTFSEDTWRYGLRSGRFRSHDP